MIEFLIGLLNIVHKLSNKYFSSSFNTYVVTKEILQINSQWTERKKNLIFFKLTWNQKLSNKFHGNINYPWNFLFLFCKFCIQSIYFFRFGALRAVPLIVSLHLSFFLSSLYITYSYCCQFKGRKREKKSLFFLLYDKRVVFFFFFWKKCARQAK